MIYFTFTLEHFFIDYVYMTRNYRSRVTATRMKYIKKINIYVCCDEKQLGLIGCNCIEALTFKMRGSLIDNFQFLIQKW